MEIKENVGTFLLNSESLTILYDWGVRNVSILSVSGTVTVKGTMKLGVRTDDSITVPAANPLNLSFDFPIDGLEIDATGGSAILITGK